MKHHLYIALVALLGTVAGLQAQSSNSGMSGSLRSVSRDTLDNQLTAKNIIGKDVYSSDGERLGQVHDLVLPQTGSLSGAFGHDRNDRNGRTGSSANYGTGSGGGSSSSGSSGSTSTGATGSSDGSQYRTSGTGNSNTSGSSGTGTYGSSSSSTNTGRSGGNSNYGSAGQSSYGGTSSMSQGGQVQAVISSGGFLRGGRDFVQVDLSSLTYDSTQDRLVLAVSQSDWNSTRGSSGQSSRSNR